MLEVRKITGIRPNDWEVVDRAFDSVEPQKIACCNWADEYPYTPDVRFRMFHTGDYLMVRFDVAERYTAALVDEDNGRVWTDSCVEIFIAPDEETYYNFETSCIGHMLLGAHRRGEKTVPAPPEVLASVKRHTSLPSTPFEERVGDNRWHVVLAIPPQALFQHGLEGPGAPRQPLQVRRQPLAPPFPVVAPHTDGEAQLPPPGIFRSCQVSQITL